VSGIASGGSKVKNLSSSQTLSFNKFNTLYKNKYNTTLDPDWLGWFVGFAEGDGFIGTNEGISVFVLTQKESKILNEIKETLKFGYVKEFDGFSRYIVREQSCVFLLFHLFNGNLHLLPKIEQLVAWEKLWNSKNKNKDNPLKTITKPVQLSLNNSWFSGFVDAEGCFNAYVAKNNSVCLRFIVDQKEGALFFKGLKQMLNFGSIYNRKNNNARYAVSNLISLGVIINYFNQFPLRTKKRLAFVKWVNIYNCVLNKEHKYPEGIAKIKILSKLINKDND
jgi:hypothetical protein